MIPETEEAATREAKLLNVEGWIESAISANAAGIQRWKDDVHEAIVELKEIQAEARDAAHLTMGGAGVRCQNCGTEVAVAFPCPIKIMVAISEAFAEDHATCEESARGKARYEYDDAAAWLKSWDTGISALTIYSVLGHGLPVGDWPKPDVPHDPADFGRCHRLLEVAPGWRERMGEVADRHPAWRPLVDRWDDLTNLYKEEFPTGKAPKLYALMKELIP